MLDAAIAAGFPCGGWCPTGRRAEDGRIPDRYPVAELPDGGYPARTVRNLLESDGTLILYRAELDGGTALTRDECRRRGRPYLAIDAAGHAADEAATMAAGFIDAHDIQTLNVAGPRAGKWPGAADWAHTVIAGVLSAAGAQDP